MPIQYCSVERFWNVFLHPLFATRLLTLLPSSTPTLFVYPRSIRCVLYTRTIKRICTLEEQVDILLHNLVAYSCVFRHKHTNYSFKTRNLSTSMIMWCPVHATNYIYHPSAFRLTQTVQHRNKTTAECQGQ